MTFAVRPIGGAQSGPMYRYWSIFVVDNNGAVNIRLGEIELRGIAGGATLTNSSTPVTSNGPTGVGSLAALVDGSITTPWSTNTSSNLRIQLDLGVPTSVKQVAIGANNAVSATPKNFRIEGSNDGTTFDVLGTFVETGWAINSWKTFDL